MTTSELVKAIREAREALIIVENAIVDRNAKLDILREETACKDPTQSGVITSAKLLLADKILKGEP